MVRVLVVDGANVVGSRPDGWWKDRAGAAQRLHERLLVADLSFDDVVLVLEGAAKGGVRAGRDGHLRTVLQGTPDEISLPSWHPEKSEHPTYDERFEVTVNTEGTFEEAHKGKETGRTHAKALPRGDSGVQIPRSADVAKFWQVIEECIERADEANRKLGK